MVISGTLDEYLEADELSRHCKQENIKLELIEGADHSLSIPKDIYASIDTLKKIVKLF
jgi:predicted alpha/beta-hydrolase family hydrolase